MKHQIVGAAFGLWLGVAGAGMAQQSQPVVVVELYTSQGCSSCPPADEYFSTLIQDKRVMPLALHVDYWDYIGWADSFANPDFTERQKTYAAAAGSRTIYTPQFIVGGAARVEGHRPEEVAEAITETMAHANVLDLKVLRQGAQLSISAQSTKPFARPLLVQVVRYIPQEVVDILHGENAGKSVVYTNIVTDWDLLGNWDGAEPLQMQAPVAGDAPLVVILQNPGPSGIMAAARLE